MSNQLSIINTEQEISLKTNKEDMAALFLKSIIGIAPLGSTFAELITAVIPNQKLERVIDFIQILNYRIQNAERKIEEYELKSEEFTDLLEDALGQASRALSKERLEYIASLLKNSLTDEELEHIEKKKLLWLLGELNDIEIIWLKKFSLDNSGSQEYDDFCETHKDVFERPDTMVGGGSFSQRPFDKKAFQESYLLNLSSLRLIRRNESTTITKVALIEIESTDFYISDLGQLLLRYIDFENSEED